MEGVGKSPSNSNGKEKGLQYISTEPGAEDFKPVRGIQHAGFHAEPLRGLSFKRGVLLVYVVS
jgi:hypothetical protein